LLGIFWTAQQVIVVRQEDEDLDLQIELFLRALGLRRRNARSVRVVTSMRLPGSK